MFSETGREVIPIEYDYFDCTCDYDQYKKEINKIIGIKNKRYYLINLNSKVVREISRPKEAVESGSWTGIVPANYPGTSSVPYPQYPIVKFPQIKKTYKIIHHCETIYVDRKPRFVVFCTKENGKIDYVGENGVEFFVD